ncbi:MAG TPA: peptidoglycan editing factor PgeF [Candidatus Binataceae bacterium]
METQLESQLYRGTIPVLRAWDDPGHDTDPAPSHGFLSREGGVSRGAFASMNLSYWVGDDRAAVAENWRRFRALVPRDATVARLNQVHGAVVQRVTRENARARPTADGMVTAEPGIILGIYTADCVPILLLDSRARIAGAIHAGWRGIIAGIPAAGMCAMVALGGAPAQIRAALGPSIGLCCFEVDAELAERFGREVPGSALHARPGRPGKAYLDLRAIVRDELVRAGVPVANVSSVGPCTRCASERFFSRRAAGGATTGLQMSFIGFDA